MNKSIEKEEPKINILPAPIKTKKAKYITTFYISRETNRLMKKAMKTYGMNKEDLLNHLLKQI